MHDLIMDLPVIGSGCAANASDTRANRHLICLRIMCTDCIWSTDTNISKTSADNFNDAIKIIENINGK